MGRRFVPERARGYVQLAGGHPGQQSCLRLRKRNTSAIRLHWASGIPGRKGEQKKGVFKVNPALCGVLRLVQQSVGLSHLALIKIMGDLTVTPNNLVPINKWHWVPVNVVTFGSPNSNITPDFHIIVEAQSFYDFLSELPFYQEPWKRILASSGCKVDFHAHEEPIKINRLNTGNVPAKASTVYSTLTDNSI
jgi:hypothetical protein